ncbi:MAG: hydrogenase nickel incorporation protein HypB [Pseudomonadota bacterium]
MCTICGCETATDAAHAHGHTHGHAHAHDVPSRLIQLEQDILAGNNHVAAHVREHLAAQHTLALNWVSSPGSGKTSLLVETVRRLKDQRPVAVIEGDQQTSLDADRIRATGVSAVQINTGKGCHLDARMVHDALHDLPPLPHGVLMIENVGNLVCPAAFDLGEATKVLVFSVTEGEDKPLKYPDMFQAAGLILLNKCDLLPYLQFDVDKALAYVRQVNPDAPVLQISATTGQGFDPWLAWIERQCITAA